MTRLRAAWSALRTGKTYADGYMHGQADTFNGLDAAIAARRAQHNDHMAARVAADHYPFGQPRPANQPLRLLHGGAR